MHHYWYSEQNAPSPMVRALLLIRCYLALDVCAILLLLLRDDTLPMEKKILKDKDNKIL